MPSNQTPLGALPARFRRERVLIIGCGDVGLRVARAGHARVRLLALTSSPARVPQLRERGITPLRGDLDLPQSLARLAGLATRVVYLAPPPAAAQPWWQDPRSAALLRSLRRRTPPRSLVYGSTTGVYGDRGGAWIDETAAVAPATPRAHRRVHAESMVRWFGRGSGTRSSILRIPGIYAADRAGGARERLQRGMPVLRAEDDVYTNHIHADDLAQVVLASLWRGRPQRIYHASDDSELKMGDYFDLAADLYGLPRPPRIARDAASAVLPVGVLSFMGESRRLRNRRLADELRVRLRYPTAREGLVGPP
ncbi:NAD-dependent epimerase/dehydratase family protein [Ramlibacter sp. AW1]|uniref:NAD-dependent epimerase/dehydratase family protein n=1 Tax=Ramlibacter aurantiacus TaxID=2801330 RepID=A0A936ZJF8_9BURK|nr:NAD-dependent epimerase/dehydratase family protein [Ramlibacter aurantiacus]MBL0420947.1 NAD-dependent epimerase/dehydratase family protein [Ramlibacter aurantiacus]